MATTTTTTTQATKGTEPKLSPSAQSEEFDAEWDDDHDEYDFALSSTGGGGGGGKGGKLSKKKKGEDKSGPYSAKHTRIRENRKSSGK